MTIRMNLSRILSSNYTYYCICRASILILQSLLIFSNNLTLTCNLSSKYTVSDYWICRAGFLFWSFLFFSQLYFFNSFAANVTDRRLGSPPLPYLNSLIYRHYDCCVRGVFHFHKADLGYSSNVIKSKTCKVMILENLKASYGMISLTAEINVALRKQIYQKIGSERVNYFCW